MKTKLLSISEADSKVNAILNNSVVYNAMVHPFTRMVIKGAIWYQGTYSTASMMLMFYQQEELCSFVVKIYKGLLQESEILIIIEINNLQLHIPKNDSSLAKYMV